MLSWWSLREVAALLGMAGQGVRAHHEGVVAARDGARDHVAEDALVRVLEAGVPKRRGEDQGAGLQSIANRSNDEIKNNQPEQ